MTSIGYELIVISACVLGGVSLKGGIGKISYVVAGILILGTVENAMNLLNISPFAQYVVRGLILLAAVIFDRYKQKRNALSDAFFHNNLTFFPPQPAATTVGCSSLQMATPSHCLYLHVCKARSAQNNKKREGGEPGDRTVNRNPELSAKYAVLISMERWRKSNRIPIRSSYLTIFCKDFSYWQPQVMVHWH